MVYFVDQVKGKACMEAGPSSPTMVQTPYKVLALNPGECQSTPVIQSLLLGMERSLWH